jgi:glycerol-3-phosphate dehydrogenase subunit B
VTYDVIVVGAGLAGLTAALRLTEHDQRVLVIAKGVGATHLAPSVIDVLGYAGDKRVESPQALLPGFVASHPGHPYTYVAGDVIAEAIDWIKKRAPELGYQGRLDGNWLLPTAVGAAKPSTLVPETMVAGDLRSGGRFVFVGLRGLKDFYASYVADNVVRAEPPAPVTARAIELDPPLGRNSDPGSVGFARRFEEREFRQWIMQALAGRLETDERVGFPAVLGLESGGEVWRDLEGRLGRRVFEVPLLPPSVPGIRLYNALTGALRRAGARIVIGDRVSGNGSKGGLVAEVSAESASRPVAYRASSFVLATGGFASGGLELDSHGAVRETVFGLPVAGMPEVGTPLFTPRYFDTHPVSRAGVAVDALLRPVDKDGRVVHENLYAAGAILAGAIPWREHSGNGISLSTGYAAAAAILKQTATASRSTARD